MKRKTPIKRSTTPIKRKAAPKAKRSTINKNRALREAVLKRCLFTDAAGDVWPRCEMLVYANGEWARCPNLAVDPSHVIKRVDCKAAKHDPNVCVGSCRPCHEAYHAHSELVMFPVGAIERAQAAIMANANEPYYWHGVSVTRQQWIDNIVDAALKQDGDPF